MSKPLFSVIVPVYDVEKYLKQCVDSVLSQSFPNYELILVDDGSNDASGAICDAYADTDARVVVILYTKKTAGFLRRAMPESRLHAESIMKRAAAYGTAGFSGIFPDRFAAGRSAVHFSVGHAAVTPVRRIRDEIGSEKRA